MSTTIDLGGAWRCRADSEDRGVSERWFASPPAEGWVLVDLPAPAQRALGLDHRGVSWHQRQEAAPALAPGERLWLCCESAATDAEFWVNGTSIGRGFWRVSLVPAAIMGSTATSVPGRHLDIASGHSPG